jgi:hypothetical protein
MDLKCSFRCQMKSSLPKSQNLATVRFEHKIDVWNCCFSLSQATNKYIIRCSTLSRLNAIFWWWIQSSINQQWEPWSNQKEERQQEPQNKPKIKNHFIISLFKNSTIDLKVVTNTGLKNRKNPKPKLQTLWKINKLDWCYWHVRQWEQGKNVTKGGEELGGGGRCMNL